MVKDNGATTETEDNSEESVSVNPSTPVTAYTCVRCGFVYHKQQDYEPFLCYRCMRFLAKRHWALTFQIIPAVSTTQPNVGDV